MASLVALVHLAEEPHPVEVEVPSLLMKIFFVKAASFLLLHRK
jgi:hypothetical protein